MRNMERLLVFSAGILSLFFLIGLLANATGINQAMAADKSTNASKSAATQKKIKGPSERGKNSAQKPTTKNIKDLYGTTGSERAMGKKSFQAKKNHEAATTKLNNMK